MTSPTPAELQAMREDAVRKIEQNRLSKERGSPAFTYFALAPEKALSVIDALETARAALQAEREAIAAEARRCAGFYSQSSDGRNTFIMFAEWVDARAHHAERG